MIRSDDVIVAIGTAPGTAGLAVVRLSGSAVLDVAAEVVPALRREAPDRKMRLCSVVHPESGELIDRSMVCFMAGPRSYTAEDVVEIQTHGGVATVRGVVRACLAAGARMARPGEFTLRAFLNGRVDLTEAEAVGGLVGALSDRARQVALRQLRGDLRQRVGELRGRCLEALAEVEARLDFPQEELEELPGDRIQEGMALLKRGLEELLAQAPAGRLAREGARVVLIGRPNVGKSSLLNALVGEKRAIVHSEPGTTRDWVEGEISMGGLRVSVVDTAGQRIEAEEAEALGAKAAMEQAAEADLVLLVVDLAEAPREENQRIWRRLEGTERLNGTEAMVVLNKVDLVCPRQWRSEVSRWREILGEDRVAGVISAVTGEGLEELKMALMEWFERRGALLEETPVVSELRHVEALDGALGHAVAARAGFAAGEPEEVVALELRACAVALGEITGEEVTEELLERIFSRFCIGK